MSVDFRVGDTREVIATIPDDSVSLIATSPPFYQLRSYVPGDHSDKGLEIGSEPDPATFLDTLLSLTAEWGRVLAPWGSIAVELGDTYSGSGGAGGDYNEGGLREGQGKFDGSARASRRVPNGAVKANPKSLALIPELYRVALAYGFNPLTGQPSPAGKWLIRNVICWHRPNPAVGALGDKVRPSTSYIVIATRSPRRWFDLTAVRTEPTGINYGRQTSWNIVASKDATNPKRGERAGDVHHYSNAAGAPPLDTWTDPYDGTHDPYDGTHDTWTLTTQPSPLAHYAMWPAKLAERLILMMCPLAVCRICGEPRRRVEGPAEYVQTRDGSMPTVLDMREGERAAIGVHNWSANGAAKGDNSVTRNAPTLGWTDCNGRHAPSSPPYYRPGLVLDPFAGSGTTLAVADLHHRDAIGIDFDSRNAAIYPARYLEVKKALYGTPAPMPGQGQLAL